MKNQAGYKTNWEDDIVWKELPKPQEKTYSSFIIPEELHTPIDIPFIVFPSIQEDVPEIVSEPIQKTKPTKVDWNYHKIKQWLKIGCPKVVEPKNLEPPPPPILPPTQEPITSTYMIPPPKIYDIPPTYNYIYAKNEFMKKYWTLVQWGRKNTHQVITQFS
jgi:hypothetical protein